MPVACESYNWRISMTMLPGWKSFLQALAGLYDMGKARSDGTMQKDDGGDGRSKSTST
ncbi:hypothetical protein H4217_004102 [Coemansia sp. RSA 1939]|nr:hypothetical protein H4217_004102 [Coemansia sp. RSA 1939]